MQPSPNPRLEYLNAVRAFALLLGILFHASLSFSPVYFGWAVMDISTSPLINHFMLVSHSFRMELFFLIAGFFSHMSFRKKGYKPFLLSRIVRIGIPLIIGWFVLRPLIVSGWVMGGESLQGDVDIFSGLVAGFSSLSTLPSGFLTGTHLWFLYYLLLFTVSFLLMQKLLSLHLPTYRLLNVYIDKAMEYLCKTSLGFSVLVCTTVGSLWFMSHWGVDTPDKSLIPNTPVTILYGSFFLVGWLLQKNRSFIGAFTELTWEKIFSCIVGFIVCIQLGSYQSDITHAFYPWLKLSFLLGYASMMWGLVMLTMGLFKKLCNTPNAIIRYVADASYWLYLIHLPIVVWLQIAFAEIPLHWSAKWVTVFALTIFISLVLYEGFVRSTRLGKILNGRKQERLSLQKSCRPPLAHNS